MLLIDFLDKNRVIHSTSQGRRLIGMSEVLVNGKIEEDMCRELVVGDKVCVKGWVNKEFVVSLVL